MKRYGRRIGWSIVVLAILALLGVGWKKWGGPIKHRVKEWARSDSSRLAEAIAAYDRREWEVAAELTRPLLKSRVDNPQALSIYARASARLEHDRAAAAIYQGRLGASPLQTEDLFLLGLLNVRAGRLEAAFEVWEKAAREGDGNPELLDHLARLAARLQRLDDAADAARRLSRQPSWEARGLLLLGEILALLDDHKASADALRQGLNRDPSAAGALFSPSHYRKRLARGLLQLGQPEEARQALQSIQEGSGQGGLDPEAEWLMSRAWLQEGNLKVAARALALAGSYRAENPLVPEPSPFVGAASCIPCHRDESRTHEKSRHARTFHHGRSLLDLPFPDRPLADPDDTNVTHTFTRDKDSIKVETRAGQKAFELVVEYAFGTSDHYVTMIGRDKERLYRALRLSSYHTADGVTWGRTAGDVPDSNSTENIRGELIRVRDGVVRCLYCHVTFYRDFRDPRPETGVGPEAADAGIGCERCHGPGGNHLKAIKGNFAESAIMNAGTGGAKAIGTLCADCHIVGSPAEIRNAPDNPEFVRSPALTMTFSRCFTESDGGMSCMTCHDAHRDDQAPASFYEAKCLGCHAARAVPSAKKSTVCPVNPARSCLECHMPKVPIAALHRELTDHYIRVNNRKTKPQKISGIADSRGRE